MKKGVVLFLVVLICGLIPALGLAADFDAELAAKFNEVVAQGPDKANFQIDAATVAAWIKDGKKDLQILDVRAGEAVAEQFAKGHIPGAIHIPYHDVFQKENLKKIEKSKVIVVVCHMAATAGNVVVPLRVLGYDARALLLGMAGWEKDYSAQGFVEGLIKAADEGKFPLEKSK